MKTDVPVKGRIRYRNATDVFVGVRLRFGNCNMYHSRVLPRSASPRIDIVASGASSVTLWDVTTIAL